MGTCDAHPEAAGPSPAVSFPLSPFNFRRLGASLRDFSSWAAPLQTYRSAKGPNRGTHALPHRRCLRITSAGNHTSQCGTSSSSNPSSMPANYRLRFTRRLRLSLRPDRRRQCATRTRLNVVDGSKVSENKAKSGFAGTLDFASLVGWPGKYIGAEDWLPDAARWAVLRCSSSGTCGGRTSSWPATPYWRTCPASSYSATTACPSSEC